MTGEKCEDYDGDDRCERNWSGMCDFIGLRMSWRCSFWLLVSCIMISCSVTTAEEAGTSITAEEINVADFYKVECNSHYFHLSVKSFAAIWMLTNAFIFICSFAIFMKYWCYKAFTSDTAKGY
uniref:Envelope glycoprotein N n=1 Tax=Mastomys natalensis cytomegalovirus 2 TaxID=2973540 RepID=A0A9Y1N5X8_9BETA|nr:envelope glycoprotein N [Mastomys natalensis cytomegalovirus 2]WEG69208.1 envelope glycoprotein N [Mastomys natalensis cytomegalovirus 2]WEG69347.1 envelope glycoprotein N [Mastomys natalensis cytomegalovirus 2]WEG69485.1 envelope glycoprotein N [Mastomys natalensis cytomegalovirus 2]WEG69623.1 envelope glycoprotein N [Mastomys natalensis cytomegalovirus 2]